MPALTTIVAPVALMIGVIYTFNLLNDGSELVVINATGARQWSLLKPVLLIGAGVAIFMASMTLYFSPLSMRLWRELVTDVRGNVVSSLLQEGEFIKLAPGLTFQLRQRMPDGTLHGIFMSDTRDTTRPSTYLAERGAVLDNALGVFLVMADGTIQQGRSRTDRSPSSSSAYAFDLSSFSSTSAAPAFRRGKADFVSAQSGSRRPVLSAASGKIHVGTAFAAHHAAQCLCLRDPSVGFSLTG